MPSFTILIIQAQPTFKLTEFASGFKKPVDIANCGDDRLFIIEQEEVIKIIDKDGNTNAAPFLDIKSKVGTTGSAKKELLGLVFHPKHEDNGLFFVNYTNADKGDTHIAKYKVSSNDPNVADPNSIVVLVKVAQPYTNHDGGDLAFGKNGYLYGNLGDGGSGGDPQGNGQNKQTLLAKMIRIDVDNKANGKEYAIPTDNPFVHDQSTLDEIWAIGYRNPWRFSFDRENDDMWIADVGESKWEELNFEPADSKGGLKLWLEVQRR